MPGSARRAGEQHRPTLAVFKLASCDGCQLTLLNCEDELLTLAGRIRIANFAEATRAVLRGPYDVALVEGSITTAEDARRVTAIRKAARHLITIGACATSGGIQALRNFADVEQYRSVVYPHPGYLQTLDRSTAVASHVRVDFELRGCPVDKGQLLEVLGAYLQGRRPRIPEHSVCLECKRAGTVCLAVAGGTPCLGPVTQAGCGALCPRYGRGCFGCFGPAGSAPNTAALADRWRSTGVPARDVVRLLRGVTAGAEPFRRESLRQEAGDPR
jgi:coenzyme F420-reducing hydrogenase gamma subunit